MDVHMKCIGIVRELAGMTVKLDASIGDTQASRVGKQT